MYHAEWDYEIQVSQSHQTEISNRTKWNVICCIMWTFHCAKFSTWQLFGYIRWGVISLPYYPAHSPHPHSWLSPLFCPFFLIFHYKRHAKCALLKKVRFPLSGPTWIKSINPGAQKHLQSDTAFPQVWQTIKG